MEDNKKSEKEVLSEYFYQIREIWNDIDSLNIQSAEVLNFIVDVNTTTKEYNGEWPIHPDSMVGLAYRILNKMSALSEMYSNEEIFDEDE